MNVGPVDQAQVLLLKAAEDETILVAAEVPDSIFGFHAQQAVEKLIKALLSQLQRPVRAHPRPRQAQRTACGIGRKPSVYAPDVE